MFDVNPESIRLFILTYPIFLFSLSFHELAHAITAKWGGDMTSAYRGRITMNPIAHIDPVGTVLMPLMMAVTSGLPLIGWAKPVPVMDINFRRGDSYGVVVALAGPFSNLLIALFAAIVMQTYLITVLTFDPNGTVLTQGVHDTIMFLLRYTILINTVLMCFNLIPIPPLDGSHVLWHWFIKGRPRFHQAFFTARQFGFILLILMVGSGVLGFFYAATVRPVSSLLINFGFLPFKYMQ